MERNKAGSQTAQTSEKVQISGANSGKDLESGDKEKEQSKSELAQTLPTESPNYCVPHEKQAEAAEHCSSGETSLSVTPKDVDSEHASSRDIFERHLHAENPEQRQQDMLDDAIDLSFPASDPTTSAGGVTRIESTHLTSKTSSHRSQRSH